MAFDIEAMKNNGLIWGGARPSLFRVTIPLMPGGSDNLTEKISFVAKAASIPPSIIDFIEIPYMSRKIRVNGDRMFPEWAITIMNDEDFKVRDAFEKWHQYINKRRENCQDGSGRVAGYKIDISVHQFSKACDPSQIISSLSNSATLSNDVQPIRTYQLIGAFPTRVDEIGLDWDQVNRIEEFDVTFAYDYWEPYEAVDSNTSSNRPLTRNEVLAQ